MPFIATIWPFISFSGMQSTSHFGLLCIQFRITIFLFIFFISRLFLTHLISIEPPSFVVQSIFAIEQLTKPISEIVFEIAPIGPSIVPSVDPIALLFISVVVTLIPLKSLVAYFPDSIARTLTLLEISSVGTAISPQILSISFRKAVNELSSIKVAIAILLFSLTMFESILECSNILVSVGSMVNSLAIRKTAPPLTFVVLHMVSSFGMFGGKVEPVKIASSMFFVVHELTNVQITVAINFDSSPFFFIVSELTLIYLPILIDLYSPAVSLLTIDLSKKYFSLTFYQLQFAAIHQHFQSQVILRKQLILCKKVTQLTLIQSPYMLIHSLLFNGLHSQNLLVQFSIILRSLVRMLSERYLQ